LGVTSLAFLEPLGEPLGAEFAASFAASFAALAPTQTAQAIQGVQPARSHAQTTY
jgi:hypothetical protein